MSKIRFWAGMFVLWVVGNVGVGVGMYLLYGEIPVLFSFTESCVNLYGHAHPRCENDLLFVKYTGYRCDIPFCYSYETDFCNRPSKARNISISDPNALSSAFLSCFTIEVTNTSKPIRTPTEESLTDCYTDIAPKGIMLTRGKSHFFMLWVIAVVLAIFISWIFLSIILFSVHKLRKASKQTYHTI